MDCFLVKVLVSNGANVNTTASAGWTALNQAAENGHFQIVEVKYWLEN